MTCHVFLVSQSDITLAYLEAGDKNSASARAKGLGTLLDFSPSLPISVERVTERVSGVPFFRNEYFEMMGFTS